LYNAVLAAAFGSCAKFGASYSHHHGIGLVKAPWFVGQQGVVAAHVVRGIQAALDPGRLLNPGKLGAADA
jgi:alkyldihydroxyacetonephosphate synthase